MEANSKIEQHSENKNSTEKSQGKEALELLLSYGYQEYKHLAIDRQSIQLSYTRTYISLSSLIIASLVSSIVYLKISPDGKGVPPPSSWSDFFTYLFILISFLSALAVFIGGVDLLRGRGKRPIPFLNIKESFTWLKSNKNQYSTECALEILLLESLIEPVVDGVKELGLIVAYIGSRLRLMSIGLITSTCSGLLAVVIRIF